MDHKFFVVAGLALTFALFLSPLLGNVKILSGGKGAVA
jgi:hypothetical protein